jgi:hypothetical protein
MPNSVLYFFPPSPKHSKVTLRLGSSGKVMGKKRFSKKVDPKCRREPSSYLIK